MSGYNAYPLGKWHEQWKRPELDALKKRGYQFNDPSEVLTIFEKRLADFTGAPEVVLTDSCTDALFLCFKYFVERNKSIPISVPKHTYLSVPMAIEMAGHSIEFYSWPWVGDYVLDPAKVVDAAMRFRPRMHSKGYYTCLSFQYKKRVPIGKGGAILLDSKEDADLLRRLVYEGRGRGLPYAQDDIQFPGWNMYMTPEDAARGLIIMDDIAEMDDPHKYDDVGGSGNYTDLIKFTEFQKERIR